VELYDIPESSKDTWGQTDQTPTLLGEYWAEIIPLKGDEMLNVRQMWPTATHQVYMRWLGSDMLIQPRMVIKALNNNSFLHVVNANNTEYRNRQWKIACEEKVGASA